MIDIRPLINFEGPKVIPNGCFISFEGIDGCGKSVQSKALVNKLETSGYKLKVVREPGGTAVSEKIRAILLDREHMEMSPGAELFLYEAARAQLMHEYINPALDSGEIVICDRFTDSTLTYQGNGRGLDENFIETANKFATGNRFPDCTFILDITWEESVNRRTSDKRTADRMELEQKVFFERVRQGYLTLARMNPQRLFLLDGSLSISELEDKIYNITVQVITRLRGEGYETDQIK